MIKNCIIIHNKRKNNCDTNKKKILIYKTYNTTNILNLTSTTKKTSTFLHNFIYDFLYFNPKFSYNHAISTTRIVQGWKDIKNKSSKLNSTKSSTHSTFSHSMNFPKV